LAVGIGIGFHFITDLGRFIMDTQVDTCDEASTKAKALPRAVFPIQHP
jgi:hypothetical protein